MKAVVQNEYGDSGVLHLQEMAKQKPESHDVLIQVYAIGVNPADWKFRNGILGKLTPSRFPIVLGFECAGVVEAVGEMVTDVKAGDRVVASLRPPHGSYAEYVIAQDKDIAKLPDGVGFKEAASLVVGSLTALQALRDKGHLRPKDRVLINGASGGVGVFAVQIAKELGAYVTGVCSTENVALVRELGADEVIDYHTTDFTKGIEKYNVVFDAVSKSAFDECRDILTEDGVYVATVPSPKRIVEGLISTFTSQKSETLVMDFTKEDMNWVLKRVADGTFRTVIDQTYPFEAVAQAHAYSETGKVKGKLVLVVQEEIIPAND